MDLQALPFPAESFDGAIAISVLQFVPDDRKAFVELVRVLKPGGWCLILGPLDPSLPVTDEDSCVTTDEARKVRFGHPGHHRRYGADIVDRMQASGLSIKVIE